MSAATAQLRRLLPKANAGSRTAQPVWLLDIDGVLNPATVDRNVWPSWRSEYVGEVMAGFTIATDVLAALHSVHASGRVEIRWCTTWQEDAVAIGAAFGLPRWKVEQLPMTCGGAWSKHVVAARVLREHAERVVVWTDDEITHRARTESAVAATLTARQMHALAPDPTRGLTPDDLDAVLGWLG